MPRREAPLADLFKRRVFREGECVFISVDNHEDPPEVVVSDTYPKALSCNGKVLSLEQLQWLLDGPEQRLDEAVGSIVTEAMVNALDGPLFFLLCHYDLDRPVEQYFDEEAMENAFRRIIDGMPLGESLERMCADVLARKPEGTSLESMDPEQASTEMRALCTEFEQRMAPAVIACLEEMPRIAQNLKTKLREHISIFPPQVSSTSPPYASILAGDIPGEIELFLRCLPQSAVSGEAVYFAAEPDEFSRGTRSVVAEAYGNTGGHYLLGEGAFATNATADRANVGVPPWRSVAIHEITHCVDKLLYQGQYDGSRADEIIPDALEATIRQEIDEAASTVELSWEVAEIGADFQERVARRLFPDRHSAPEELIDALCTYVHSCLNYQEVSDTEESEYEDDEVRIYQYSENHLKAEHIARGAELIHVFAIAIRALDTDLSQDVALKRASHAVEIFSPALVQAVRGFWRERDTQLAQLREQQGPLEPFLAQHDALFHGRTCFAGERGGPAASEVPSSSVLGVLAAQAASRTSHSSGRPESFAARATQISSSVAFKV